MMAIPLVLGRVMVTMMIILYLLPLHLLNLQKDGETERKEEERKPFPGGERGKRGFLFFIEATHEIAD